MAQPQPWENPLVSDGGLLDQLEINPDPPRVQIHLFPLQFKGAPSQDVRSWLKSMEIVFIAKGIITPTDKLRWIRSFVEGQAANFFDSLPAVQSWEEFKDVWIRRYTVWGTDLKYRRYFYSVRQEHDYVEIYISEFQPRLELIETPSEKEVFTTFVNGLDEKIQTHLYIERASTFAEAVRLASA